MIEFHGVSVHAPGTKVCVLQPTTLTLTEGHVSVIGANGSGKSTLARLINGLARPASGHVLVNGRDTMRHTAAVRRDVGFLFTNPAAQLIMPTVIEDMTLSLRSTVKNKAARAAAALDRLEEVGLASRADVSVHSLSGGQKQLLAIAGVLALHPTIVVADEPTTLLDLRWRKYVDGLIEALPQQVIEVTHDLDAALRTDRTLVVDGGAVIFDGTPQAAVEMYRERMALEPEGVRGD